MDAMTDALDSAELSGVDVDQGAWAGVLVAPRRLGDGVDAPEPVQAETAQDARDGGDGSADHRGNLDGREAATA